MIKIHVFKGWSCRKLGIKPDMEVGHLYSDTGNRTELVQAAMLLGLREAYYQDKGVMHFDLWGRPLILAKELHKVVGNAEFIEDYRRIRGFQELELSKELP